MAFAAMIGICKDKQNYTLKLPASKDFDKSELINSKTKCDVNALVNKAINSNDKRKHQKYPNPLPDKATLHELLLKHPCPLGQGPVICQIDSEYHNPHLITPNWHTGEDVMIPNTVFRHDKNQKCAVWTPVEKNYLSAKYEVTNSDSEQHTIHGAASERDMSIIYTCEFNKCKIHCSCSICMDKSPNCRFICKLEICSECTCQCKLHEMKLSRTFNPESDQFTLVTNQLDSYRYAVPHAGIPQNCTECKQNLLEHQVLHLVFHLRCRFCRQVARPLMDANVLTAGDFDYKENEMQWSDDRTCSTCLKQFSGKYVRIKHENTVHNDNAKKLKCSLCDKTYLYQNALDHHNAVTHKVGEQKFTCEQCGAQFLSKVSLTDHRKSLHEKSPGIPCQECEKIFSVQHSLQRHMREVHHDRQINLNYIEDLESIGIKCDVCEKLFTRKFEMLRHVRSVHKNAADEKITEKPFKCLKCLKSFTRKDVLSRHIKTQHP